MTAGIECDLGGISSPDHLWLWMTRPNRGDLGGDARSSLFAHAGIAGATPGTCRNERPAMETWSFGGLSGRLVCYENSSGDAVLLWVFDDAQLFGKAVRDDRDMTALLDWWEEVGRFTGP